MSNYAEAMHTLRTDWPVRVTPKKIAARDVADGAALASALVRVIGDSHYKHVRARISDFGAIWLHLAEARYRMDFPKSRLNDALRSHRYVLTAVPDNAPVDDPSPGATGALSELLWRVGLLPCTAFNVAPESHLRMQRWPNFPTLPHNADHLQLCALLNGRALRFDELVQESGLPRDAVNRFVTACVLSGCLQANEREPDFAELSAPPRAVTRDGFFQRLRRRFGL